MTTPSTNETPFQRWYRKNREAFNQERRERYAKDKKYRKRLQNQAKERREKLKVEHPGVSTKEAAEQIGRTSQTILEWERRGLIPEATIKVGNKRRYTDNQISLMGELSAVMEDYFCDRDLYHEQLPKVTRKIKEYWDAGDY